MQEPPTPLSQSSWSLPLGRPIPPPAAELRGGRPGSVRAGTGLVQHGGPLADRLTAWSLVAQTRGPT